MPQAATRTEPTPRARAVFVFLVGAFGGVFPTLFRIAMDLQQHRIRPTDVDLATLFAMAIFAVLGGGVAAIWRETDLKKVFYIGLGLPSFLTVVNSNVPAVTASAQSRPAAVSSAPRQLTVQLPDDVTGDVRLIFMLANGKESGLIRTLPLGTVTVPDNAVTVRISTVRGDSDAMKLRTEPGSTTEIKLRGEADPWHGFKYGIGLKSKPVKLVRKR